MAGWNNDVKGDALTASTIADGMRISLWDDANSERVTAEVDEFSGKIQNDIFDNDAVTESTVASDLIPIEQDGEQKVIVPKDLMIQMKGYKEYTFAIRQSGTDAPTISVIKDDFGLETPLTAIYNDVGFYTIDATGIGYTDDTVDWNLKYNSLLIESGVAEEKETFTMYHGLVGPNLYLYTTKNGTLTNGILANTRGVVVSIQQTLT